MALAAVTSFIPLLSSAPGQALGVVKESMLTGLNTLRSCAVGMIKEPAQTAWISAIAIGFLKSNQHLPNPFIFAAGVYLSLKAIQNLTQYRQQEDGGQNRLIRSLKEERKLFLKREKIADRTIQILHETIHYKDLTIGHLQSQLNQSEEELYDLGLRYRIQSELFSRVIKEALWNQLIQIAKRQSLN